jgi:hypothetical protein
MRFTFTTLQRPAKRNRHTEMMSAGCLYSFLITMTPVECTGRQSIGGITRRRVSSYCDRSHGWLAGCYSDVRDRTHISILKARIENVGVVGYAGYPAIDHIRN